MVEQQLKLSKVCCSVGDFLNTLNLNGHSRINCFISLDRIRIRKAERFEVEEKSVKVGMEIFRKIEENLPF